MKKKMILMVLAGAMVLTFAIGGTMAGFSTQSEQGKTDIKTKQLGVALTTIDDEGVPLAGQMEIDLGVGMPGDTVELQEPCYVKNNIEGGYDLYTRVTIYKYWEDHPKGLSPDAIRLYTEDENGKKELQAGDVVNNWIIWYADTEQIIAYYKLPLAADASSSNILNGVTISSDIGNEYTNKKIKIEIQADAVQKAVAESSMPAEWGVYPTFNGDVIESIAE